MAQFVCVCGHSSVNHAFGTCNEWDVNCGCKKMEPEKMKTRIAWWYKVISKNGFAVGFVQGTNPNDAVVQAVTKAGINDTSHVLLMSDADQDELDKIFEK